MPRFDRHGELEVIGRQECLELLAQQEYGRLGVVVGRQPVVLPINYAMDGDRPVFRTGPGGKFHAMVHGAKVALEIDEVDPDDHSGGSVLVEGRAEEVVDAAELERLAETCPLLPWAEGDRSHWMVIVASRIGGRRVGPAREA